MKMKKITLSVRLDRMLYIRKKHAFNASVDESVVGTWYILHAVTWFFLGFFAFFGRGKAKDYSVWMQFYGFQRTRKLIYTPHAQTYFYMFILKPLLFHLPHLAWDKAAIKWKKTNKLNEKRKTFFGLQTYPKKLYKFKFILPLTIWLQGDTCCFYRSLRACL